MMMMTTMMMMMSNSDVNDIETHGGHLQFVDASESCSFAAEKFDDDNRSFVMRHPHY